MNSLEHWNGTERPDGIAVERAPAMTADGKEAWIVVRPGRLPLLLCPRCDKPMQSERAAKLVADVCYPIAKTK